MNLGLKKIISGLVKDPSKIIDIAEAWMIAKNPTESQKALAQGRWNICLQCDEFREKRPITGEPFCNDCGCSLNKKIFSKNYNECPLKKWKQIDDLFHYQTQKQGKTII
jgi:uncharacterized paraquat-inducible protein A